MDNMKLYNSFREVPETAKKPILGGRLKGMTDINPMWRIQALTEKFGPVGIGWYYEIVEEKIEDGPNGEKAAFVKINLFVEYEGVWSKPIVGLGGSNFIAKERNGLYMSDECFKMALTDAIGVACKALGIGADVYWQGGQSKYDNLPDNKKQNNAKAPSQKETETADLVCSECASKITTGVKTVSTAKYGRPLCLVCQNKQ